MSIYQQQKIDEAKRKRWNEILSLLKDIRDKEQPTNDDLQEYLMQIKEAVQSIPTIDTQPIIDAIEKQELKVDVKPPEVNVEVKQNKVNVETKDIDIKPIIKAIKAVKIPKGKDYSKTFKTISDQLSDLEKAIKGISISFSASNAGSATEEKQDAIVNKLQEIADNTDTLELKADQINLNTDEIEAKLDALNQNKATASKQDDIITAIQNSGGKTYTVRLAEHGSITYIGKAEVGSLTSDAVWQISKLNETNDLELLYADGNANFDNKWTDYLTLNYS